MWGKGLCQLHEVSDYSFELDLVFHCVFMLTHSSEVSKSLKECTNKSGSQSLSLLEGTTKTDGQQYKRLKGLNEAEETQ